MTIVGITTRQSRDAIKYEAAKKIRNVLDEAKESFARAGGDEDDFESEVLDLVTGEDE